jgi:hypothetical protein
VTEERFRAELRRDGFEVPVLIERAANGAPDEHPHPFEARALIVSGEITRVLEGREASHRTGDLFHPPHAASHVERYGPAGVRHLSGRE